MTARLVLFCSTIFLSITTVAQTYRITGRILDDKDTSTLIGVTVIAKNTTDTTIKLGATTDVNGNFEMDGVPSGTYVVRAEYIGYTPVTRTIKVTDRDASMGTFTMKSKSNELKGVTITGTQTRAEQMGDTTQFHADAYKTNPDATAEDLVTKMPGVTSDNSGVKVNGEAVQQVYVDGKPFFGTDPTLALKNLPSEVIDKIQVFDKLSDQSTFTGFDDGNAQKTMNIITKRGKSEGEFGKFYAGYGTDDRYIVGGNLNIFHGDQRISILGLSNNINQQNFSSEDLLGVSGGSGRNRGGGGRSGGYYGGGGNNFLVGQQNGITTTNSFGVNYSDNWGKKVKVTGSYFYNGTDNTTNSDIVRNYFTNNTDSTNIYHETDVSETKNYNHRVNLRLEYTIDSFNSIIFTPGISFQQNNATTGTAANDSIAGALTSSSNVNTTANNSGFNSSDNLLIQHKFRKPRRTVSLNINTSVNNKTGDGTYSSTTASENTAPFLRNQRYDLNNGGYNVYPSLNYTEPVGKKGQLMANYSPSYAYSSSDKNTYDVDPATGTETKNDTFTNTYNSTYVTQKGGLSYRIGDKKLNFNIGANAQYATLDGSQTFPNTFTLSRNFSSILPNAFFNYRFEDGRNLRIMYRTSTQAPSVTQLQDVVDISNPLLLKTGNADLKQDYEQTFILRYGLTKAKTGHNFFLNIYANYASNYIGNATIIPTRRDTFFTDPFTHTTTAIPQGSQLTRPENMDGYFNGRSFLTYGIPLERVKCNLNLSGGLNYTRTPGRVNEILNYSNNYTPSAGIVLSSNVSEKIDFTVSYYGSYNFVNNTSQTQANNNYYNHTAAVKFNWLFLKHFVFNTNVTENYYTAFSSSGNQDYYLWNAYLGYKFMKNNAMEARISAYDILNQNKSVTRTVTETYIENNVTQVLRQYFMFQLTYTLRNFKGAMPTQENREDHPSFPGGRPWGHDHGG